MSILDKIKKNSTIKESAILSQSKFFTKKDMIPTSIPIINVALSGRMDGGLTPGLTMWAGPSKHFKTAFSLLMARSYLDKYPDAALLFYDSEFGTPQSYFDSFGIDTERVLHTPITDLEQLKFDAMQQIDNLERGDKIMIIIDSIGNLASKKEVQDALDGKSVADMSRAKQIKSLFRMVTPHLTIKDILDDVVNPIDTVIEIPEESLEKSVDPKPEDEEDDMDYESDNEEEDKWDNIAKACWSGYTQRGMKDKNGRMVPNCVPVEKAEDLSEADQVKKSFWGNTFFK